jgi:hypothetical protein
MDNYLYDQSMKELLSGDETSLFYYSTSQGGHGGAYTPAQLLQLLQPREF